MICIVYNGIIYYAFVIHKYTAYNIKYCIILILYYVNLWNILNIVYFIKIAVTVLTVECVCANQSLV